MSNFVKKQGVELREPNGLLSFVVSLFLGPLATLLLAVTLWNDRIEEIIV